MLFQNQRISSGLKERLLEINRFRNLLFHGKIDDVDDSMVNEIIDTREMWEREKSKGI